MQYVNLNYVSLFSMEHFKDLEEPQLSVEWNKNVDLFKPLNSVGIVISASMLLSVI